MEIINEFCQDIYFKAEENSLTIFSSDAQIDKTRILMKSQEMIEVFFRNMEKNEKENINLFFFIPEEIETIAVCIKGLTYSEIQESLIFSFNLQN